jgi:hypothetical protein
MNMPDATDLTAWNRYPIAYDIAALCSLASGRCRAMEFPT